MERAIPYRKCTHLSVGCGARSVAIGIGHALLIHHYESCYMLQPMLYGVPDSRQMCHVALRDGLDPIGKQRASGGLATQAERNDVSSPTCAPMLTRIRWSRLSKGPSYPSLSFMTDRCLSQVCSAFLKRKLYIVQSG